MIAYDTRNWLRVLLDVPKSPVFRTLFFDVLGAGVWAAVVVYVETRWVSIAVPLGPAFLSILGIILGLLLVFRTNTAYDRWWEGRRLWGQLVNLSRGLSHQLAAAMGGPDGAERRAEYAALLAEFPTVLAQHLRRPRGVGGVYAPADVIRRLHAALHADLEAGRLRAEHRLVLAPMLQQFDDITGACERIRHTPIPYSYASYIKQFVLLFALLMPFGLAREFGYGTVVASMATFFATAGLELLATEIEEPFGTERNDLPLEQLSAKIAVDTAAILG